MIPKFLLWLLFNQCILAQATECDWVRIIYRKLGGNAQHIPEDCCRMRGVECADGHVVQIDWSPWYRQGLKGSIPPEFGNLVNLQKL
jgi:hypothetical protein